MARVVCEREGGLDLGGGLVLAFGVNDVDDAKWAGWAEAYAQSDLMIGRVVYEVAATAEPAPVDEPVAEPAEPAPAEAPEPVQES